MTAKEYIVQQYGETWLRTEWSAGDVTDALDGFARYRTEEEERLFQERLNQMQSCGVVLGQSHRN